MRFLVTGGTGFIGRRLVARLVSGHAPEAITCLIKTSEKPAEIASAAEFRHLGIRIIEGDLDDAHVSREPLGAYDVVFHLAGDVDTAKAEHGLRVNDQGTERLLDKLGSNLRGCRIVYASSANVMDRNGPVSGPMDEGSPCVPRTPYGLTKLRGEQSVIERATRDGYSFTVFRLPTVYGRGSRPGGMFDVLAKYAANGALLGKFNWPGRTSIIFVDDVAEVMVDLGLRPEAADQIYCIASDENLTVGEIARQIGRLTKPVRPVNFPRWVWAAARWVAWNRTIRLFVAPFARTALWRFSFIVDDGLWFDTSKFRAIYCAPLVQLPDGLSKMKGTGGLSVPHRLR